LWLTSFVLADKVSEIRLTLWPVVDGYCC